jgi:Uncharacterised methyltransferase family (DUF6094)
MRLAGKQKLGYFPLSLAEAERIRRFVQFPLSGYAALDRCIGDRGAFTVIAGNPLAIRYGIELDAYRVEQAREVGHHVVHGDILDVHCPVESLSLLYLNPPYDFECGQSQNRRLEKIFFEHWSHRNLRCVLAIRENSKRSSNPLQGQESLPAGDAGG